MRQYKAYIELSGHIELMNIPDGIDIIENAKKQALEAIPEEIRTKFNLKVENVYLFVVKNMTPANINVCENTDCDECTYSDFGGHELGKTCPKRIEFETEDEAKM